VVTNDWGTALVTSVAGALALFLAAVPRVVGFVLIVLVGWFVAGLLAAAVAGLLRAVRFNEMAERAGLADFARRGGMAADPAGVLAAVAKWFVRLIVLVVAFDALGLPAVSQVLQQFLLWIPNLVVALVVLVIGGLLANALAGVVRSASAEAGMGSPALLASLARFGVWGFAVVVAVHQVGVAAALVDILFMGLVGALALAIGLAFGLGGRDTAAQIVRGWYESVPGNAPRLAQAAGAPEEGAASLAEGAAAASTSTDGVDARGTRHVA
jgi:hypothetical protein